jgi:hypothetical protein
MASFFFLGAICFLAGFLVKSFISGTTEKIFLLENSFPNGNYTI